MNMTMVFIFLSDIMMLITSNFNKDLNRLPRKFPGSVITPRRMNGMISFTPANNSNIAVGYVAALTFA